MNETEKMQTLHQRIIEGKDLTAEEQTAVQTWYKNLDDEENLLLNNSRPKQNIEEMRRNLAEITDRTSEVSREVKNLIAQNEQIRRENQILKKSLETRLLEKVA